MVEHQIGCGQNHPPRRQPLLIHNNHRASACVEHDRIRQSFWSDSDNFETHRTDQRRLHSHSRYLVPTESHVVTSSPLSYKRQFLIWPTTHQACNDGPLRDKKQVFPREHDIMALLATAQNAKRQQKNVLDDDSSDRIFTTRISTTADSLICFAILVDLNSEKETVKLFSS